MKKNHEVHEEHEEEKRRMELRVNSTLPPELEDLIRRVIGAAIEVHRHLGPGFIESIYQKAMCYELGMLGITFEKEKELIIRYKDLDITGQRLDMLVEKMLVVELKTVDLVLPIHEAQLISYLKTMGIRAGLIINFKVRQLKLGIKRIVL